MLMVLGRGHHACSNSIIKKCLIMLCPNIILNNNSCDKSIVFSDVTQLRIDDFGDHAAIMDFSRSGASWTLTPRI